MNGILNWRTRNHSPIGVHVTPTRVYLAQIAHDSAGDRLSAIAATDPPQDPAGMSLEELTQLGESLRHLVKSNGFHGRSAVGCLNTSSIYVNGSRFPVMAEQELFHAAVEEVEDRLPFDRQDAEFRVITAGEIRHDGAVKRDTILFASPRTEIDRRIHLLEAAGLTPSALDIEPAAVLRSLAPPADAVDKDVSAYLYLGPSGTTLSFGNGTRLTLVKEFQLGGRRFDDAVARHLEMPFDQARAMRRLVNASPTLDPDREMHRAVIDAIRPDLETLVSELERCFRYQRVTFRGQGIRQLTITGADCSAWLVEYLGECLGLTARFGNPLAPFGEGSAAHVYDEPGGWAVAIGLCLRPPSVRSRVA